MPEICFLYADTGVSEFGRHSPLKLAEVKWLHFAGYSGTYYLAFIEVELLAQNFATWQNCLAPKNYYSKI